MKKHQWGKASLEQDIQQAEAVLASLPLAAQKEMEFQIQQFLRILEAEVEAHRTTQVPGGFVIAEALDQKMQFLHQARVLANFYQITTEQACFALMAAMKKMAWL